MFRAAKIADVSVQGEEHVRRALESGAGVMITPNHSFHYDSYVLGHAAHRIGRPFHFLTAWQVFAMSTRFQQWVMQRHGCFSIDRESARPGRRSSDPSKSSGRTLARWRSFRKGTSITPTIA